MFLGHFAVGFGAKKWAPRTNLAVLIAAPLLLDILWPYFLLLGWEKVRGDPGNTRFTPLDFISYPWSHSLLMSIGWATLFAAVYYLLSKYWPGAVVVWLLVISHWILDWVTHRPDLPLYPGGPQVGLGLWNSVAGTMAVEFAMFATGVWLYMRATRARDRIGLYPLIVFLMLLPVLYLGGRSNAGEVNVLAIAWTGIVAVLILLPWAWWFDRHRASEQGFYRP